MTAENQNKQRYDSVGKFSERSAIVKPNGKYGFIDRKGYEVVPPIYDIAYHFQNSYADILFKDKWRPLDRNDNEVLPCQYNIAKTVFADGLIWVKLFDTWLQIDCAGNMVKKALKSKRLNRRVLIN
jgi:hypothetical protein